MAQNGATGKSQDVDYSSIPDTIAAVRRRTAGLAEHRRTGAATDEYYTVEFSRNLNNLAKTWLNAPYSTTEDRLAVGALAKYWQEESLPVLKSADAVNLGIMLDAMRRLNVVPEPEWLDQWQRRSLEEMGQFGLQRLANIFNDMAQLQILPSREWYAAWQDEAIRQMGSGERGHATMLYDHALLQIEPTAEWMAAWTEAVRQRTLDISGVQNVILAHRGLGWKEPDWLDVDMRALQANVLTNPVSHEERSFARCLHSAKRKQRMHGVSVSAEEWNPTSLSPIDYVLREKSPSGRSHTLFVQIDGPSHYLTRPDGTTIVKPTTALQTRILEHDLRPGEALIRLGFREFDHDPEKATQRALDALGAIGRTPTNGKKHGAYPSANHVERASRNREAERSR